MKGGLQFRGPLETLFTCAELSDITVAVVVTVDYVDRQCCPCLPPSIYLSW